MEKLIKIVKIASKKSFKILKENSPYFCKSLNKNIYITNIFYKHISGYSKNRKPREIIERLSIIPLIKDISFKGEIFQTKENIFYEKKFLKKSYKISLKIKDFYFIILTGEKKNGELILLSCFIKYPKQKKDQFVLRTSSP